MRSDTADAKTSHSCYAHLELFFFFFLTHTVDESLIHWRIPALKDMDLLVQEGLEDGQGAGALLL